MRREQCMRVSLGFRWFLNVYRISTKKATLVRSPIPLLLINNISAENRRFYSSPLGCLAGLRYNQTMKSSIIAIIAMVLCLSSFCAADTGKD